MIICKSIAAPKLFREFAVMLLLSLAIVFTALVAVPDQILIIRISKMSRDRLQAMCLRIPLL